MDALELLTRASIWLSVGCWALGVAALIQRKAGAWSRWLWTAGLAFYLIHSIAAFARFYDWSHAVALEETAAQTLAATGFASGAGIWFNYAFGLIWLIDAAFWWTVGTPRYTERPKFIQRSIHGFMAFMIFNGTVVFGHGFVVAFGALVFAGLGWLAMRFRFRRLAHS